MKVSYLKISLLVAIVMSLSSCTGSFRHDYLMKGQVIAINDNQSVVVCVGTADGARIGQELNVYTFVERHSVTEGVEQFVRNNVGKVVLEEIINEHYANAKVLSGEVGLNDMVQLINE